MIDPTLEINHFYNKKSSKSEIIIKDSPYDFIVQEITSEGLICNKSCIFDIEKYVKSINFLIFIFDRENVKEFITDEKNIKEYITDEKNIKEYITDEKNINKYITDEKNINKYITDEKNIKEYITDEKNIKEYITDEKNNEEVIDNFDIIFDKNFIFNHNSDINNLKTKYLNLQFFPLHIKNKDLRTKIYKILSFNPFINTKTINDELIIKKSFDNTYVFTLMKIMMNTVDACKMVERHLNSSVSFAGNKDKKALTYQEISCKCNFINLLNFAYEYTECTEEDYENIKILKFLEDIKITDEEKQVIEEGSFQQENIKRNKLENDIIYYKSSIGIYNIRKGHSKKLGNLKGNKFTIKIKNQSDLKYKNIENGFINYFGSQRFGKAKNNHFVGEKILNKEYSEALDLIIKNSKGYDLFIKGNLEECLKKCDNMERYIFKNKGIINDKKIVLGMRREIRMIYLHSYQSYLFNKEINNYIENDVNILNNNNKSNDDNKDYINKSNDDNLINNTTDVYLELKKMNDKMLKGGKRKIFEKGYNVEGWKDGDDFVITFELNSSCYATMALREL